MTYNTKQKKQKKLFYLTKLYKQRTRKDLLWRLVEYSGSWYECPRVLKLTMIRVVHKFCYSHTTLKITNAL